MSRELLATAEYLLSRPGGATAADACRARSTVYYAVFHFLAGECCKLFIGDHSQAPKRAWDHLYRSLSHGNIEQKCLKDALANKDFPQQIIEMAAFAREMQFKRESCDYGHAITPKTEAIKPDILLARKLMDQFESLDDRHRRAFCIYILFKENRSKKKKTTV